jgi:hypothetical protein
MASLNSSDPLTLDSESTLDPEFPWPDLQSSPMNGPTASYGHDYIPAVRKCAFDAGWRAYGSSLPLLRWRPGRRESLSCGVRASDEEEEEADSWNRAKLFHEPKLVLRPQCAPYTCDALLPWWQKYLRILVPRTVIGGRVSRSSRKVRHGPVTKDRWSQINGNA